MILIVDLNEKENGLGSFEFIDPVERIVKTSTSKYELIHYKRLDAKILKKSTKVILCGTPLADNDFLKHIESFSWLKEFEKPVLGICAGMQVLGSVFGSKIVANKEIGLIKMKTTAQNVLLDSEFEAYCLHQNAILPTKDFIVLAQSENCIQAIKHSSKPFYGVLFHPEVRNEQIILNFLEKA